jgi:hypothetical protein
MDIAEVVCAARQLAAENARLQEDNARLRREVEEWARAWRCSMEREAQGQARYATQSLLPIGQVYPLPEEL